MITALILSGVATLIYINGKWFKKNETDSNMTFSVGVIVGCLAVYISTYLYLANRQIEIGTNDFIASTFAQSAPFVLTISVIYGIYLFATWVRLKITIRIYLASANEKADAIVNDAWAQAQHLAADHSYKSYTSTLDKIMGIIDDAKRTGIKANIERQAIESIKQQIRDENKHEIAALTTKATALQIDLNRHIAEGKLQDDIINIFKNGNNGEASRLGKKLIRMRQESLAVEKVGSRLKASF